MIAKQYLITGIIMGIIGVGMSLLFLECNWLVRNLWILTYYLVMKWAPNGVMTNDIYLSLVTIHGTIMVFCISSGVKWYL
jgi:cytochrome c oxidase subunit 1